MERGKFQLPDRNNSSLKTKIAQCDYDKYSRHWTQNCQPMKALSQFSWLAQTLSPSWQIGEFRSQILIFVHQLVVCTMYTLGIFKLKD